MAAGVIIKLRAESGPEADPRS